MWQSCDLILSCRKYLSNCMIHRCTKSLVCQPIGAGRPIFMNPVKIIIYSRVLRNKFNYQWITQARRRRVNLKTLNHHLFKVLLPRIRLSELHNFQGQKRLLLSFFVRSHQTRSLVKTSFVVRSRALKAESDTAPPQLISFGIAISKTAPRLYKILSGFKRDGHYNCLLRFSVAR